LRAAAILAAAVGVGRFVFTPILPLMQHQADVSAQLGAGIATANYAGYLAGAVAAMIAPGLFRRRVTLRVSGIAVAATLAAMPLSVVPAVWIALRVIAGAGSAVMFVYAASSVLTVIPAHARHLTGWAYGGVGAGIAASGLLGLVVGVVGDWHVAWWVAAVLTAGLVAAGWNVPASVRRDATVSPGSAIHRPHRWFAPLVLSYFLEGVGYIVAGTFLVAAASGHSGDGIGGLVWIIVGATAVPSCALWAWLSTRWSYPVLLTVALLAQAAGIALAAAGGTGYSIAAAVLFGGTFMGVTVLSLAAGSHLQISAAVAILSAVYAVGQALGPLVVAPVLDGGFRDALLIAAVIVALAALVSGLLRIRFPHHRPAASPSNDDVAAMTATPVVLER